MKLSILALALLLGCASTRPAGEAPAVAAGGVRPLVRSAELAALSRAITAIDDAERRGDIAAERARWSAAAAADGAGPKERFLAAYASPHGEETWGRFRALAREEPASALGAVGMARIYLDWRVLDQVPRVLDPVDELDPGNALVALTRALADERAERWGPAAVAYRAVLAVDGENVEAHVGLARAARQAGDLATARSEAQAALVSLPGHAPALAVLAQLAAEAGEQEEAGRLYRELVEASPRDRPARMALARVLQARGDAAGARDQLRAALALREDAEGLMALVEAARKAGDQETEQRALERLSAVEPGGAEWRRIAEIRLAANDLDGAEKALRRALSREPKDVRINLALGQVVLKAGKPQEALELLRAAAAEGAADREALERRLNVEKPVRGDVGAIQRAVGGFIDRTYRARLKELPRLSGRLTVRVTVDGAGGGTLVEVLEDSVHDDDVRACAYWNLRDAAYPPNKPGRYSFTFSLRPPT
jgi:tetratricopeptide (TPR) repeat protein